MKKLILSAAVAAALFANVAIASDDNEGGGNPLVGTSGTVTGTNTNNNSLSGVNNNTNTIDNTNVLRNVNRIDTRNNNVNTLDQNQAQHQIANGGNSVATAQGGNATASGNGSGNSTTINQSYSDVYRDRLQVSSAYAANLTSGTDTCLGSVSGAVQTQLLGVSGGKTVVDENCVKIKNDKLRMEKALFAYHAPGIGPVVACYILTQDSDFANAMKMAGVECREPTPAVPVEDVPVPSDPANKSAELIRNQYK